MRRQGRDRSPAPSPLTPEQAADLAEAALTDHRALDAVRLDMRDVTIVTDYFLICHGTSSVHIKALADAVQEALKDHGLRARGVEGYQGGKWILLDYADVVVHIFAEEERAFYDLERLWSDAPRVALSAQG